MLLNYTLFPAWGYSYGPTRLRGPEVRGPEEGMVPTSVAQAADCRNGRETKGQRGARDRQGRERINFLSLRCRGGGFIDA